MARIRTIKPEFPQSESMGRISRDARLLFVMIWTLCDDSGRTRGNSRMLASLLFPYDDDAPGLIDGWLDELDSEGCIVRYFAEGATYIEVCNWLNHQKIDKPSASKIPAFSESSRILANPRVNSCVDQGPRTKEVDQGPKDQGPVSAPPASPAAAPKKKSAEPKKPDDAETALQALCREVFKSYALAYWDRYQAEPVVNAKVRSQIKQFCQRIAGDEAAHVAAFYVTHQSAFYVRKCHDVGSLLADAEKLRTEWATNRQVTDTQSRQADRARSNMGAAQDAMRILEAQGAT